MPTFSVGIMTFSFARSIAADEMDVPGVIRYAAELGLDAVDITERHWRRPADDVPATRDALREHGVRVASWHTGLDLVTRGPAALRERERRLRELFEQFRHVGCRVAMLGSTTADLAPEDWRREFGIGLRESADIAEEYGVTVTFENRGGSAGLLVGTAEHCLEILDAASDPRVRFTFDVGNFRYVGADHVAAFERLADTIAHVHLKDVVPSGNSFAMVPLGEGEVDNAPILRRLAERGYKGCASIECGGRGTDRDDAARSAAFALKAAGAVS